MQKLLVMETDKRLLDSKAVYRSTINFTYKTTDILPESPDAALASNWRLLAPPKDVYYSDNVARWEWWFEQEG
jgi:hypothetical protein